MISLVVWVPPWADQLRREFPPEFFCSFIIALWTYLPQRCLLAVSSSHSLTACWVMGSQWYSLVETVAKDTLRLSAMWDEDTTQSLHSLMLNVGIVRPPSFLTLCMAEHLLEEFELASFSTEFAWVVDSVQGSPKKRWEHRWVILFWAEDMQEDLSETLLPNVVLWVQALSAASFSMGKTSHSRSASVNILPSTQLLTITRVSFQGDTRVDSSQPSVPSTPSSTSANLRGA